MHEQELRQHRCCFTGHRPEKLNISEEQLCVRLGLEIDRAIKDGFTTCSLSKLYSFVYSDEYWYHYLLLETYG